MATLTFMETSTGDSQTSPARSARAILKERFGHDDFRPGQAEAVHSALKGQSLLVVMPTGSGKSLIYQLPALLTKGLTLVVSPLIALMKDQVDELARRRIAATLVNSSLDLSEQHERLRRCIAGEVDLLYVAPERFRNAAFLRMLHQAKVARLVVDEAHCISEWGHDFRPDYRCLRAFREQIGNPPTSAMTATATPRVQQDIVESLGLTPAEVDLHVHGFDRPNLELVVVRARREDHKDEYLSALLGKEAGPGIIYTGTRRSAARIAANLKQIEPRTVLYHAGLDADVRAHAQEDFLTGRARIVVATVAFGMGIDKADVRFVVHYNYPGSIEQYYQEIGRAGRDGKPSHCVLLYSPSDRFLRQFFIDLSYPGRERVESVYQALWQVSENPVLLTHQAIVELCDEEIHDGQVSSAIRLLNEAGVARAYSGDVVASVGIERPGAEILNDISGPIRHRVFEALSSGADLERPGWYEISLDQLCVSANLDEAQVRRALSALQQGGYLTYHPPFRGRGVQKLVEKPPPFQELRINWERQDLLRAAEDGKLDNMEAYLRTRGCRRQFILSYFGETERPGCDNCDSCRRRSNTAPRKAGNVDALKQHKQAAAAVLLCLRNLRFPLGIGKVTQVLTGSRDKNVLRWRLDRNPAYGRIPQKQTYVKRVIDELINQGYVRQDGEVSRPVLVLTDSGMQAAEDAVAARFDDFTLFPEADEGERTKPPAKSKAPKAPVEAGADSSETEIQTAALECVASLARPLGLQKVAAVLTGSKSEAVRRAGAEKLSAYGSISATQIHVRKAIQGLVKKGWLCYGGNSQYPVLELTEVGQQMLHRDVSPVPAPRPQEDAPEVVESAQARDDASDADADAVRSIETFVGQIVSCDRESAQELLGKLRTFHPREVILRLAAQHDRLRNSREHSRCVWAAGELCGQYGLDFLARCTRSEEANVRRLAASALGKALEQVQDEAKSRHTGTALAEEALQVLAHDEALQVRQYAEKALLRLSAAGNP